MKDIKTEVIISDEIFEEIREEVREEQEQSGEEYPEVVYKSELGGKKDKQEEEEYIGTERIVGEETYREVEYNHEYGGMNERTGNSFLLKKGKNPNKRKWNGNSHRKRYKRGYTYSEQSKLLAISPKFGCK